MASSSALLVGSGMGEADRSKDFLAEAARCQDGMPGERAGEVERVAEAQRVGDLAHGVVGEAKQPPRRSGCGSPRRGLSGRDASLSPRRPVRPAGGEKERK